MSRNTFSSSDVTASEKTKEEPPMITPATGAKMALVKPLQDNTVAPADAPQESPAQFSLTRPKVGRFSLNAGGSNDAVSEPRLSSAPATPLRGSEHTDNPLATKTTPPAPSAETTHSPDKLLVASWSDGYKMEPIKHSGPWDFKFALILVALLVLVNFALMTLLHNHHKAEPMVSLHTPAAAPGAETMASSPSVTVSTAAAVPAAGIAATQQEQAPPAKLKALPGLPMLAPSPAQAAAPEPVTEQAPAAPTAESRQELLRILNKD